MSAVLSHVRTNLALFCELPRNCNDQVGNMYYNGKQMLNGDYNFHVANDVNLKTVKERSEGRLEKPNRTQIGFEFFRKKGQKLK